MNVNCLEGSKHFHTVSFNSKENIVILINQKKLPHQFSLVETTDFYQTAAAIQDMTVRGAGAIGATAAFGFAQGCNSFKDNSLELFEKHWKKVLPAACKNGMIKKVYIQQDNLSPLQCHVKEIFIREEF